MKSEKGRLLPALRSTIIFHTKEEIFSRPVAAGARGWIADVYKDFAGPALDTSAFAEAFAHALEGRECMLKLMSMNLYELEGQQPHGKSSGF